MGGQLAVLGQQFDALVPKARDFGSIAADMMPPATKSVGEFKDTVFEEIPKTESTFTEVSQRIKDAWTMGLKDMLSGARSFSDVAGSIWGTVKEQFFTLVAQLVSKWTLGFIGQIVTGSGGLLNSVKSVFGGVGKLLTGAEGGGGAGGLFGNIGGSFLGTIGKMAGPLGIGLLVGKMIGFKNIAKTVQDVWKAVFGAISDIVGGIGKAVGGLLAGIGGLLGGAGREGKDLAHWLKLIWENSQNILNQLVGFFHAKILHMIDQFRDIKQNTLFTSRFAEGARERLKSIDAEIKALPSRLENISKSIVDGLNSILNALTSKGTIYVVSKAEAIKKQLSTLELQLKIKLERLQAELVTATGDEKNAILKQMALLQKQAEQKRKKLNDELKKEMQKTAFEQAAKLEGIKKAEAIKQQLAKLEEQTKIKLTMLQERLASATGEEKNAILKQMDLIQVQAQQKRKELIDKMKEVQQATLESSEKIKSGFREAIDFKPVVDAIKGMREKIISAQHGAVLTKPQLVMTHGTPGAPEYVLPAAQLNRLMSLPARAGHQEITINNEVKITGTIISDREFTRQKLIPEIVKALDVNASEMRRKFRRALGVT